MEPLDVLSRPAEPPDAVVRYADHPEGVIDLFLPPRISRPAPPHRLVVALHGGFWRERWDRTHLRPLANALVGRGFAVATPEYRRGPDSWPRTRGDVATALDVVAELVDAVAPDLVDSRLPYTLTGHSAGGHLALWGGLTAASDRVRRIVALAPVADLVGAARVDLGDHAAADFLGASPEQRPDVYAEADPMNLLPGGVPVFIVQGTADDAVPVDANRHVAQVTADADSVTYVELDGIGHTDLIDPLAPMFDQVLVPLLGD